MPATFDEGTEDLRPESVGIDLIQMANGGSWRFPYRTSAQVGLPSGGGRLALPPRGPSRADDDSAN